MLTLTNEGYTAWLLLQDPEAIAGVPESEAGDCPIAKCLIEVFDTPSVEVYGRYQPPAGTQPPTDDEVKAHFIINAGHSDDDQDGELTNELCDLIVWFDKVANPHMTNRELLDAWNVILAGETPGTP